MVMWKPLSLQKCKVNIWFSPTLSDEDIRREAVNLMVAAESERKEAEEQQRAAEPERDAAAQEVQVLYRNSFVSYSFLCLFMLSANISSYKIRLRCGQRSFAVFGAILCGTRCYWQYTTLR